MPECVLCDKELNDLSEDGVFVVLDVDLAYLICCECKDEVLRRAVINRVRQLQKKGVEPMRLRPLRLTVHNLHEE
jgi:hypothetical protein